MAATETTMAEEEDNANQGRSSFSSSSPSSSTPRRNASKLPIDRFDHSSIYDDGGVAKKPSSAYCVNNLNFANNVNNANTIQTLEYVDDDDDDDDDLKEEVDVDVFDDDSVEGDSIRQLRQEQRHRLQQPRQQQRRERGSSMVGFANEHDVINDNTDATGDANKTSDVSSSASVMTSSTGTFSERLRRIKNNIFVKFTNGQMDGYSHKYSIFGGPVDRWNRCYLSFCFLGLCTLLPWNFFMSANAYWNYKFRNATDPTVITDLQEKFETYLAIAAFIPNVFLLLLMSLLTKVLSAKARLLTSTIFMGIVFAVTAAFVLVNTDDIQYTFFLGTLVSVVFINGSSAAMQSGVFGLAGLLPQRFMQGVMHGQALGATIAALASILTLAMGESEETVKYATCGYFILATLIMFLSAIVAFTVLKSNYLSFTLERAQSPTLKDTSTSVGSKYGVNASTSEEEGLLRGGRGGGGGEEGKRIDSDTEFSSGYGGSVAQSKLKKQIIEVLAALKKIGPEAFSVYITFAITISVFPGIIVLITPVSAKKDSTYSKFFSAVFCFFLFNFGDLMGRTLAGKFQFPRARSPRWILPSVCLVRILFIPAFMLCHVTVASTSVRQLPTVFSHDAIFITFMVLFSISNGYFASLAMMFGPKRVAESQAEMAGSMMATFLAWGLATGAGLTYLILGLL